MFFGMCLIIMKTMAKSFLSAKSNFLVLFRACLNVLFSVFLDIGFEVPDKFLVGYALDYNEYFRDLSVSVLFCSD